MATQKPTYLELISQDEKAVQKESLKLKAQEAALELNREIVKISQKQAEIAKLQRCIPYSVAAEYTANFQLSILEDQLDFAKTVKEERFSDASI